MKRAHRQPIGDLLIYAGIYYRTWHIIDAGTVLPQHSHEWDHLTAILQGGIAVWRDDKLLGEFVAPATIKIPARTLHRFLTMTDHVVLACIHNADHADPDGEPPIAAEHALDLED